MKLKAGQPIPNRWRMSAAHALASATYAKALELSGYDGHRATELATDLDEDMVYSGLADLLGCMWQQLPAEEVETRIQQFAEAIRTARRNHGTARAADAIVGLAVKGAA